MTELKPCPCCGPKAFITPSTTCYAQEGPQPWSAELRCDECGLNISRTAATEKEALYEAVDAWNTRAERTCEIARVETGEPAEYDCDEVLWHCESCHEEVAIYAYNENGDTWADKPAFCPNCGAKVVSE